MTPRTTMVVWHGGGYYPLVQALNVWLLNFFDSCPNPGDNRQQR